MATNPSAASRNSSRAAIIDNALARARAGATISLESAARASGLSKPGLMYHFKTKTSLMAALVDRLVDSYERELVRHLNAAGGAKESVHDRYAAYLDWACTGDFDASDLVMFLDPRLREALTAQWVARMDRWLVVPADTPARLRTRLLAARLMAEGVWFGAASGALPLAPRPPRHSTTRARPHQGEAMTKWLLLVAAILSEVTGSLSLKGALDRPALYVLVVIGFVAAFLFLSAVLRQGMGLGVAYGIWGALGVATTAVMSAWIFDESLTPLMGVGIAVIIAGVLTVELGAQQAHKHQTNDPVGATEGTN